MKVVLAEKPSVARDLARVLKAHARRDGYFEGDGYQVTWAFGHLVGLKDFDDYDPALKRWSLDSLPFVPDQFGLKVIGDKSARHQFSVIKKLFRSAKQIICATDAGREGELIFRNILLLCRSVTKPFYRLWLSSLTDEAIREGLRSIVPGENYDRLYAAARSRSQADWIVGLNATRNYTLRFGNHHQLWSIGRVQTPVLAMIAKRDDEIRSFRPEKYWQLYTVYRETEFRHTEEDFKNAEAGEALLKQVQGKPFTITNIAAKKQVEKPPLLHDLTELQREMNRRYGSSAADTLKIAQKLYENKLITYPRTDSRYLSNDMKSTIPQTLQKLSQIKHTEIGKLNLKKLAFTRRIIDNNKVTDHHAIIPTGKIPHLDNEWEFKVYEAVLTRFIAVFYPACIKNITTVEGNSNSVRFIAKGISIGTAGWTELYPKAKKKEGEKQDPKAKKTAAGSVELQKDSEFQEKELPLFTVNESGPHQPKLKEKTTQPPKHYSENTLLAAMETAGKFVDSEELKEALKEKGIGTPATRASIIELLLSRKYIERKKKTLLATDTGRYLISIVGNVVLKSPELTGEWEHQLKQIEKGKLSAERFMKDIVSFTHEILKSSASIQVNHSELGSCPKCGKAIIQGKKGFGCSGWKDGCNYVLWMEYKGHLLTTNEAQELLQTGRLAEPIRISENGAQSQVLLYLGEQGQVLEIPFPIRPLKNETKPGKSSKGTSSRTSKDSLGNCPSCGGAILETKTAFSCANWKSGCKFVIWRKMAGKTISKTTAGSLLRKGSTSILKGFKSKSGKEFQAKLVVKNGKVEFDFT